MNWKYCGSCPDGAPFEIDGVDVWKCEWLSDSSELLPVRDPLYHQLFEFHVYKIITGERVVRFAAGEFSNCIWGFYSEK